MSDSWGNESRDNMKELGERIILKKKAGSHIDAYQTYYNLVGDTNDGAPLSPEAFKQLERQAEAAKNDPLFVYWRHVPTGANCRSIGPSSPCFCGHRYRDHAWFNTQKLIHCRMRGCRCANFGYVPIHGSQRFFCHCKHVSVDHDPQTRQCTKCAQSSKCSSFTTSVRCSCGNPYHEHCTIFETNADREAVGLPPLAPLPGSQGNMGGVVNHFSLLDGVEQAEILTLNNNETRHSKR